MCPSGQENVQFLTSGESRWQVGRKSGCNIPVGWARAQDEPEQRIYCNRAVHAFNIPVSEAKDGAEFAPDASVRLKAEYFERTDGRGRGDDRGECSAGVLFP